MLDCRPRGARFSGRGTVGCTQWSHALPTFGLDLWLVASYSPTVRTTFSAVLAKTVCHSSCTHRAGMRFFSPSINFLRTGGSGHWGCLPYRGTETKSFPKDVQAKSPPSFRDTGLGRFMGILRHQTPFPQEFYVTLTWLTSWRASCVAQTQSGTGHQGAVIVSAAMAEMRNSLSEHYLSA